MSDYKENIEVIIKTNAEQITQEYIDLSNQINQLKQEIEAAKKAQKELDEEYKMGAVSAEEYAKETAKITKNLESFNGELKKSSSKLDDMNKSQWTKFKEAIGDADSKLGGLLKTAGKLIKNPYTAIILGIVSAFKKLKDSITDNSGAMIGINRLMNSLQALIEPLNKGFNAVADAVGNAARSVADFFFSISNDSGRLKELSDATEKLTENERTYALEHAKNEAQISRLRADAINKQEYSIEQRILFIREAMQLEQQDLRNRKHLADEKIRVFELETANQKSLSKAQKDSLNELLIEKQNADKEYANSQRRLNWSMNPLVEELISKAGDLGTEWSKVAEEINNVYTAQLQVNLQTFLKDTAETADVTIKKIDKVAKYLSEEDYAKYIEARGKILQGFYKNNVEGAEEVVNAVKDLESIINPKEFAETAELVKDLVNQTNNFGTIVTSIENQIAEATKKAQEKRNEAYQKAQNKIVKGEKDTQTAILTAQRETLSIQLDTQEEWLKNQEGLSAEVNKENVRFAKESLALSNQIEDLQKKQAAATAKELKEAYQEQIDALIAKGNELANTYQSNISKILKDDANEKRKEALDELQLQIEIAAEEEDLLIEKAQKEKEINEQRKKDAQETAMQVAQSSTDILWSFASVAGSIADHYHQKYEEIVNGKDELSQEEAQRAIEALEREKEATKAQLILQQAVAIGNAIVAATSAASMSGPAAAFVYAATAATITAGLISSFIAANDAMKGIDEQIAAVKAKATGYATGGYITGAGTGTSDSIPARLSNGEAVINARSTERFYDLLSAINQAGGGVAFPNAMSVPQLNFATGGVAQSYENTYRMIENAVANIQPVVSVKEITKVQNRLKTKEII